MICWCVKFGKQTFFAHIRPMIDDRLHKSICLDYPLQHLMFGNVWFINIYINV